MFSFFILSLLIFNLEAQANSGASPKNANPPSEESVRVKKWQGKDVDKGFEGEDSEGAYYYEITDDSVGRFEGDDLKIKPKKENYDKGLKTVMEDGTYLYKVEESEVSGSFSFHAGPLHPPVFVNSQGLSFSDIYSDDPIATVFIDMGWQTQFFGRWELIFGSGMGQKSANGRFKDHLDEIAMERYTINILPNHLSLAYRFQFTKNPYFIPYIRSGLCGFIFIERRDDGQKAKNMLALGGQAAGGVKINLGILNPQNAFDLDSEYGINSVWLDIEYRYIKGTQSDRDITSNVLNAGISFDF